MANTHLQEVVGELESLWGTSEVLWAHLFMGVAPEGPLAKRLEAVRGGHYDGVNFTAVGSGYARNRTSKELMQLGEMVAPGTQELIDGVGPFGVSLLIAGYDDNGPQLYQVDPSGSYFSWKASAMGKNVSNAKTFLEKRYTEDMELDDAIHTAILTLKEGFADA
nr:proteasome subunit alpha type-2-like [Setaria viridis]